MKNFLKKFSLKTKPRPGVVKQGMDIPFLILVFTLLTIGLIMLFSAGYAYAYYNFNNSFHFITRQLIFAVLGVVAMFAISRIDYRIIARFAFPIFIVTVLLLIVVLFMRPLNGARRWIFFAGQTFQPSELAKFTTCLVFAKFISINYDKMKTFKVGFLPFMIYFAIIGVLMVLEPHLSGTILILAIGVIMMIVGGASLKWFAALGGIAAGALAIVVFFTDAIHYAQSRIQFWLNPFLDARGKGYQTIQSLLAIASGGLFGEGLGQSRQKYLYIPEPQNDFIFAVVAEELGFIGAVLIILLFVLLVVRGLTIATRAVDKFGSLLCVGLTMQVGIQAVLNIAVVTNTIPNTGISLPFFSYGGTALLFLLCQMGVILSISRYSNIEKV